MKQFPFIYLASKSVRRKQLLEQAKISFKVVPSKFKERTFPGGVRKTVVMNAVGKAKHVKIPSPHPSPMGRGHKLKHSPFTKSGANKTFPSPWGRGQAAAGEPRQRRGEGVILGADTLVYHKGKLLGKPKNKEAAFRMLKSLTGTRHFVYTGIALFDLKTKKWKKTCVKSTVIMKKMSDDQVREYLSKVNPLDKAGAYAIQEHGDKLIKKIEGSYTNVVGLPMEKLTELLKTFCHCETR